EATLGSLLGPTWSVVAVTSPDGVGRGPLAGAQFRWYHYRRDERGSHPDLVQRCLEPGHGAVDVAELVQAEQADPEGGEVLPLSALQRHTGGHLHSGPLERRTAVQVGVVGVHHHDR